MGGPRLLKVRQVRPPLDEPISNRKSCYDPGPKDQQRPEQTPPTIIASHSRFAEQAERRPAQSPSFAYFACFAGPFLPSPHPDNQRRKRQQIQRNQLHQRRHSKEKSRQPLDPVPLGP